ncbi:MAG: hypothetical protein AAFQ67_08200 [Pseudomonadota bacterium]
MVKIVRLFALVAAFAAPSAALEPEALNDYLEGRFYEAAEKTAHLEQADSQAFSARAILAGYICADSPTDNASLVRAERHARAALSIDPEHEEARIQLAIALGLQSRLMPKMEAHESGIGELSRKLAESVLEDSPNDPFAHGYLAVWNVEVIRRGGALGRLFLGASFKDARKHYEAAERSMPDDPALHWQYARALAAQNPKKHRKEIRAVLAKALAASPQDRVQEVMHGRAVWLADAMASRQWDDIEDMAREML